VILLLESVHVDALRLLEAADRVEAVDDLATFDPGVDRPGIRAIVTRGRGRVTSEMFGNLPDLVVVARCGAGLDNIDTTAAARAGVTVVHAPGVTTQAVAEHALMLMLCAARRLVEVDAAVKAGNWAIREGFEGTEMRSKRLGIIGLGAIGARIAEFGRVLDMDVVCSTRSERRVDVPRVELSELLATSDVVQLCVPLTDVTRAMIGADELASMKPTAVLVNTARAAIVDHHALAVALDRGAPGAYATDLWDPEPPVVDDPVLAHPRTVVTPHVAGLTDVTYRELCVRPVEAVVAILAGREPDPSSIFSPPAASI
jgi:phosphoglycerate dehydrogenase-like enzyme